MDPISLLYLALVIIAIILIVKVVKFIVKIIGFLLIGVVLFLFLTEGGNLNFINEYSNLEKVFQGKSLEALQNNFCTDTTESIKCDCIITPVLTDLNERLVLEEDSITSNSDAWMKEIKTSLVRKKKEIRRCLVKRKGKEIIKDLEAKLLERILKQLSSEVRLFLQRLAVYRNRSI